MSHFFVGDYVLYTKCVVFGRYTRRKRIAAFLDVLLAFLDLRIFIGSNTEIRKNVENMKKKTCSSGRLYLFGILPKFHGSRT